MQLHLGDLHLLTTVCRDTDRRVGFHPCGRVHARTPTPAHGHAPRTEFWAASARDQAAHWIQRCWPPAAWGRGSRKGEERVSGDARHWRAGRSSRSVRTGSEIVRRRESSSLMPASSTPASPPSSSIAAAGRVAALAFVQVRDILSASLPRGAAEVAQQYNRNTNDHAVNSLLASSFH